MLDPRPNALLIALYRAASRLLQREAQAVQTTHMRRVIVHPGALLDQPRHAWTRPQVGAQTGRLRTRQQPAAQTPQLLRSEPSWPPRSGLGRERLGATVLSRCLPPTHAAPVNTHPTGYFKWAESVTQQAQRLQSPAFKRLRTSRRSLLLISNVLLAIVLMNLFAAAGIALASSLTYVISLTLLVLTLIGRKVVHPDRVRLQRFLAPFATLAGAGSLVFFGAFRVTRHADLLQYAGAVSLLAAFVVMTAAFNRGFIRRVLASRHGS